MEVHPECSAMLRGRWRRPLLEDIVGADNAGISSRLRRNRSSNVAPRVDDGGAAQIVLSEGTVLAESLPIALPQPQPSNYAGTPPSRRSGRPMAH